jgi:hypothetical protein
MGFWWESQNERDHKDDLVDVEGRIIVKLILEEQDGVWTKFIWLRMEASGGLL